MNPIEWLEQQVPGFRELPEEDRQAIFHFALLWSLFEARALQTRASANAILSLVHERHTQGRLNVNEFQNSLAYFRQRYFAEDTFTAHFEGLNLRSNDSPELVRQVLNGENNNPADVVGCLLIVIFRLRNNLFHGVKWAYGIQGQRSNFEQANAALICAITQVAQHGA
ncbi:hypothetical protein SAMN05428957_104147 [Oryzisolibacter propanilivorax]|uniref:Apea-like HEPN domain-containing protein n=1 Tax=Oryzisolibacter propanilivorax TaxID=1527607 RepID=A0A1G9S730_9BURK|nr:hypothetical protein [Oryzisolibacter propanilivorax]SDM31211.1 hypothetical protein SAMN05428957_104147 [Oryzisolibacter propanilivorax]